MRGLHQPKYSPGGVKWLFKLSIAPAPNMPGWRNVIRLYGKAGLTTQRPDGTHEITEAGRAQLTAWMRLRGQ